MWLTVSNICPADTTNEAGAIIPVSLKIEKQTKTRKGKIVM